MPLTFVTNPEFTHSVSVLVPVDGGHREETFKVRFRVIDQQDFDLTTEAGTTLFLREVVREASDLVDANGQPVLWSDAVRDWMLGTTYVRVALAAAYFSALRKVRAKN